MPMRRGLGPSSHRLPVRLVWGLLGWGWGLAQRVRSSPRNADSPLALEDAFLEGANLPWFSYGNDFGCNAWHPEGGLAASGTTERIQRTFAALQQSGTTCLRWFLFADGRSGIRCDSTGQPAGFDDRVFPDLDLALRLADQYGIRIILVCFDFLLCEPERWSGGVKLGGRSGWIQDPESWMALETKVLEPLFARYGKHSAILAWDLFNEPEWTAFGMGWKGAGVLPWVLRLRLERMVRVAHRYGDRPVTVGLCTARALPLVRGIGLDFYQIHWYDRYDAPSPLDRSVAHLRLDRPLLLGEFPTRNSRWSGTEIVDLAHQHGYCGALAWSLLAEDEFSGMALPELSSVSASAHPRVEQSLHGTT